MTRLTSGSAAAVLALAMAGAHAAAQAPEDRTIADLRNPSTRTRIAALRSLGESARRDAAVPMAATLLDGSDDVQYAAVEALLKVYTVRADLSGRQWGVGAGTPPRTFPEFAFEAGPLATTAAAVPAEVLTNLASVMRRDDSGRIRLSAAYALGVLGAPDMGPMAPAAVQPVTTDVVYALTHPDTSTRMVVARVAGRVFEPLPGQQASVAIGDALIGALNDKDTHVREWATDSLGRLRYDRAVQALTDRASYFGKDPEGQAALHAIARIASPGSAPVLRALLANAHPPFRLLAIEGLVRIGDRAAMPQITQSEETTNDPGVGVAADYARFVFGQGDIQRLSEGLDRQLTNLQTKAYLVEIARSTPAALHPLLTSTSLPTRLVAVQIVGTSRHPEESPALEALLHDSSRDIVVAATEAIQRLRAYASVTGRP